MQGVNQLQSSISNILKIEDNRKSVQAHEDFSQPMKKIDLRDRQGSDIFGYTNYAGGSEAGGKRKNTSHQATQNNGNLTYWDK